MKRRPVGTLEHAEIAACFNATFQLDESTRMQGGAPEPLYLPGWLSGLAVIYYREDFASSALHEAAHWCLAGRRRRTLPDYGYWYVPPPRSRTQQIRFFSVESRVQALEWLLADAAGVPFRPSADNLDADLTGFRRMLEQARGQLAAALPARAARFAAALARRRCKGVPHGS